MKKKDASKLLKMLQVLLSDKDRELAYEDRRLFGASYIRIDKDGVAVRIDPRNIKIEIPKKNPYA